MAVLDRTTDTFDQQGRPHRIDVVCARCRVARRSGFLGFIVAGIDDGPVQFYRASDGGEHGEPSLWQSHDEAVTFCDQGHPCGVDAKTLRRGLEYTVQQAAGAVVVT